MILITVLTIALLKGNRFLVSTAIEMFCTVWNGANRKPIYAKEENGKYLHSNIKNESQVNNVYLWEGFHLLLLISLCSLFMVCA